MYAMISHHDPGYQPLADLTWEENKQYYASLHGYATYAKTGDFVTRRPDGLMTGFEKIYLAREIIEEYPDDVEWVWWTGTDSMITNFETKIEDKIDNNYHFIVSVDVNGINSDSFLVRNSPEGKQFLNDVISREQECNQFWDSEQRSISYCLGFPGTSEPGWPFGSNLKVCNKYKNIVKLMPQRHMNSFNYQLYHYTDHRDKLGLDGNWQVGDWLIHWPAVQMQGRMQLYNYYRNHVVG